MNLPAQIAKNFREVYYGGNWTGVNYKDVLQGITWQQATTKIQSFNTIAALVFHTNYYVDWVLEVFDGKPLSGHDNLSFALAPINSQQDWEKLLANMWTDADKFANYVEQMPEQMLWEDMADKKYGNFYRNIHGVIEHCHYHLGQIVLIKKMIGGE